MCWVVFHVSGKRNMSIENVSLEIKQVYQTVSVLRWSCSALPGGGETPALSPTAPPGATPSSCGQWSALMSLITQLMEQTCGGQK